MTHSWETRKHAPPRNIWDLRLTNAETREWRHDRISRKGRLLNSYNRTLQGDLVFDCVLDMCDYSVFAGADGSYGDDSGWQKVGGSGA